MLALVGTGFGGGPGAVAGGRRARPGGVRMVGYDRVDPSDQASTAAKAPERWSVLAVAVWFMFAAWSDVLVVAMDAWRFLEPVGAAMLLGVLAQAIVVWLGSWR